MYKKTTGVGGGRGVVVLCATLMFDSWHSITAGKGQLKGAVLIEQQQKHCGVAEVVTAGNLSGLIYIAFTGTQRVFILAVTAE